MRCDAAHGRGGVSGGGAGLPDSTGRVAIVVKHNKYARHQACSICDADRNLCIGPCLFEEGTWGAVCDECARKHAPGLLAMINDPEAQRAYWAAEQAHAEQRQRRVETHALNVLLKEIKAQRPPPSPGGRPINLLYVTQPDTAPPRFVFFVNRPKSVPESYRRYLERRIRETFGFQGSPIQIAFRRRK